VPRVRRIVFLVESRFNARDRDRFGIETLEKAGFAVEVWDLTKALHPGLDARPNDPIECAKGLGALADLGPDDFVFCVCAYLPGAYPVYRALAQSGARYGIMRFASLPSVPRLSQPLTASRFLTSAFVRLPMPLLGLKPADLVMAGGEGVLLDWPPATAASEVVWAHAFDYDQVLRLGPAGPGKGAVFLDEYLPYHPDYERLGHAPYVTPSNYFPPLNRFFSSVERALGAPVTIAAHPRAHYDRQQFDGRAIVRGKTAELVRDAALVLAHASYSINFAVLYKKPVVFLTTPELDKSPEGPLVRSYAAALGQSPRTPDQPFERPRIDEAAYAAYRRAHVKRDGSPEKPFWTIAAERIAEYR
jgi:hypothetical protein